MEDCTGGNWDSPRTIQVSPVAAGTEATVTISHAVWDAEGGTPLADTETVTTLGEEFVQRAAGTCEAADFPTPGETVTVQWQEAQQNFVITGVQ